jgi:uncharacterized protein (DUF1697 family)
MPRYVAFLRAINVGGHTVKMGDLRRLFETMGFANVETFIASGNVIFESNSKGTQAMERKIENRLRESLGYEVDTFVRATSEVTRVAQYKPFDDSELEADHTIYVGFLADTPSRQTIQKLVSFQTELDRFHVSGREIYWLCRTKSSDSKFSGALLERTLGMRATIRNSTTVRKIAVKFS